MLALFYDHLKCIRDQGQRRSPHFNKISSVESVNRESFACDLWHFYRKWSSGRLNARASQVWLLMRVRRAWRACGSHTLAQYALVVVSHKAFLVRIKTVRLVEPFQFDGAILLYSNKSSLLAERRVQEHG